MISVVFVIIFLSTVSHQKRALRFGSLLAYERGCRLVTAATFVCVPMTTKRVPVSATHTVQRLTSASIFLALVSLVLSWRHRVLAYE